MKRLLAVAAAVLLAFTARAQQHENVAKGFAADKVFQFNNLDQVNMFNLALNVGLPIGPSFQANGGLSYGVVLRYSGNNWDTHWRPETTLQPPGELVTKYYQSTFPYAYDANLPLNWNAGLGWNVSFGRLIPPGYDPAVSWTYESEDGSKHNFFETLHEANTQEVSAGNIDAYGHSAVSYTSDNTYLRMRVVSDGGVFRDIEFPDGTVRRFPYNGGELIEIRDRSGNRVTFTRDLPPPFTSRMTISDGVRSIYINYLLMVVPPHVFAGQYLMLVKSIDVPAFGQQRAVYTFHYGTTGHHDLADDDLVSYGPAAVDGAARISRRLPANANIDCTVTPEVQVPILTSVSRPDGTSFEMHYDLGDNGASFSESYFQNPAAAAAPAAPPAATVCGTANVMTA
jgi:hypothetical protein